MCYVVYKYICLLFKPNNLTLFINSKYAWRYILLLYYRIGSNKQQLADKVNAHIHKLHSQNDKLISVSTSHIGPTVVVKCNENGQGDQTV